MKPEALSYLVCPRTQEPLALETFDEEQGEIIEGKLTTRSGAEYPIIRGVPRLLPARYLNDLRVAYPKFFQVHRGRLSLEDVGVEHPGRFDRLQQRTARSFGTEWSSFNEIRPDHRREFMSHFDLIDLGSLRGQTVLDAGCGMGRWSYFLAEFGCQVFCADLSAPAIDAAFRNLARFRGHHCVQADVHHLPFRDRQFDLVVSSGVLHHLPDPDAGFRAISRLTRGGLLVYLYYRHDNKPIYFRVLATAMDGVRLVTTRLVPPALFPVAWVSAALLYMGCIVPASVLGRVGLRRLASYIPFDFYAGLPFRSIYCDTYDRLSAPIERRYTRAEVALLFDSISFTCAISDRPPYWHAYGIRNVTLEPAQAAGERSPVKPQSALDGVIRR